MFLIRFFTIKRKVKLLFWALLLIACLESQLIPDCGTIHTWFEMMKYTVCVIYLRLRAGVLQLFFFFSQVQSNKDGRQYAVKYSAHCFRGNSERNRSVREARNHERVCPHPHILNFVSAWEECRRVYIQTELCSTSLLFHTENQPLGPGQS